MATVPSFDFIEDAAFLYAPASRASSGCNLSKRNVSDAEWFPMFIHKWIFATRLLESPETHGDPSDPSEMGDLDSGTSHGLPSRRLQDPGKIAFNSGLPISHFQGGARGGVVNHN